MKIGNVVNDTRFKQPPWNTILWRYMSFEKFIDLILNRALFFTNLSLMTDKNEAEIPIRNEKELKKNFQNREDSKEIAEKQYEQYCADIYRRKKSCFVNCWVADPYESYALWKIYLGGGKNGIAIKTNTKNLIDSINSVPQKKNDKIFFGKVSYDNYIRGDINFEILATNKRKPYGYESEARLIVLRAPKFIDRLENSEQAVRQTVRSGIKFNINPEILIKEIYISPFGDRLFFQIVQDLIKQIMPSLVPLIKNSEIKDN